MSSKFKIPLRRGLICHIQKEGCPLLIWSWLRFQVWGKFGHTSSLWQTEAWIKHDSKGSFETWFCKEPKYFIPNICRSVLSWNTWPSSQPCSFVGQETLEAKMQKERRQGRKRGEVLRRQSGGRWPEQLLTCKTVKSETITILIWIPSCTCTRRKSQVTASCLHAACFLSHALGAPAPALTAIPVKQSEHATDKMAKCGAIHTVSPVDESLTSENLSTIWGKKKSSSTWQDTVIRTYCHTFLSSGSSYI